MTQKRSRLPGSMPGGTFARGASDAHLGAAPMRPSLASVFVHPGAPPLKWGLVVAASLIVAETLVLYPLERIALENTLGVVYVLGVVVVAIGWGFWLAAATSVASVLAFDYFHIPPIFALSPVQAGDWVALTIFLVRSPPPAGRCQP